jgi:hypothetical protein
MHVSLETFRDRLPPQPSLRYVTTRLLEASCRPLQ